MMPFLARRKLGPIARGSMASLGVKIFALAMGFSSAVLAARLLGPAGYGEFAVGLSGAAVTSILGGIGINGLAVREMARLKVAGDRREIGAFVRWSISATAGASAVAAACLALISIHAGPFAEELLLAVPLATLLALLQTMRGITQGSGEVAAAQLPLDVIRWVLIIVALGGMLVAGTAATPLLVLGVFVAALLVALLVAARGLVRIAPDFRASRRTSEGSESWLAAALPFLGIALLGVAGAEVNTILLGWLAGPEQAGLFQPIARIAPIMILAADALAMPLSPRAAASWYSGDRRDLAAIVRKASVAGSAATALIVAAILVSSPAILGAFGPDFVGHGHYLYWIGGAQLINAAVGPAPLLLSIAGQMRHRIVVQLTTFLVQIGLAVALIPAYGAGGAVLALSGGIVVWSFLHWIVAWRTTGIDASLLGWVHSGRASGHRP